MGQLMKGQEETFNPQIHTEALSLSVNQEKDNAIHKATINRFSKYSQFTSLLFLTDRVNKGAKRGKIKRNDVSGEIYDNAYRVKYQGMEIMPLISMGAVVIGAFHTGGNMTSIVGVTYAAGGGVTTAAAVVTDTIGSFGAKHDVSNNIWGDKMNPNDKIGLGHGLDAVDFIITAKEMATTGDHYIYHGKFIVGGSFNEESFDEGEVLLETGNIFGEGSTSGFMRDSRSWWEIFYSHKSRYTLRFTGDSLRQRKCAWVHPEEPNATSKTEGAYWEFQEEERADRLFSIFNELALRYNVSTMKTAGPGFAHQWLETAGKNQLTNSHFAPHSGITAPQSGDGFITSIKDTIDMVYDPNEGLAVEDLQTTLNLLSENSPKGSSGNLYVLLGDKIAHQSFSDTMARLIGLKVPMGGGSISSVLATNVMVNMNNVPQTLGFDIEEYEYLGNKVIFIEDTLLSHPGLFGKSGGLTGHGDMYFFNISSMPDGTSMFELFSGARGRFFIRKFVDGLHSLDGEGSSKAASGFDGATEHYFSELMGVNYFTNCSGIIRASKKYTGRVSLANQAGFAAMAQKFPYLGPDAAAQQAAGIM